MDLMNDKLNQIIKESRIKQKAFLENPDRLNRINKRKKIIKFGKALDRNNNTVTSTSNIHIYIEKPNQNNNIDSPKKKEEEAIKIKCRYCNGNHMSFKCKEKNKKVSKTNTIKMSNLPPDITEEELKELLSDYGIIERVSIPDYIKFNKKIVKHALIRLQDYDTAQLIKNELDETNFDNYIIGVTFN